LDGEAHIHCANASCCFVCAVSNSLSLDVICLYTTVMENGAKGASVSVSGKLRAQRAKTMKFTDGYMISSGHPVKEYVDSACKCYRKTLLRYGFSSKGAMTISNNSTF
jgi:Ribosomal protein S3, C-terminal domain